MNRRIIKIVLWVWIFALGSLIIVMVTRAQGSDTIRAMTEASNNANITVMLMLFLMGLPFLWWYLSGRRLDRMERIYAEHQAAEARRVKSLETALEKKDAQLDRVITDFKNIVTVMNRRAAQTERNIGILEKTLSLHNREADQRHGDILDSLNEIARQGEKGRAELQKNLASQQNAMIKNLGQEFNRQFNAMSKMLAQSINNLASKLPITVVQAPPPVMGHNQQSIPITGELTLKEGSDGEETT